MFIIPLSKDFFNIPIRQRILYYSSLIGFLYYSSLKGFLSYSNPTEIYSDPSLEWVLYDSSPTEDTLLFLSQVTPVLFESDKGFFTTPLSRDFFTIPLPEDFFTIPVRQRILHYSSLIGFLYYSSLRGVLYYSNPTKNFFTIPIRQRILHYSSLGGFLHYSSPTTDSLLFLSQGISWFFQSDRGFLIWRNERTNISSFEQSE